MILADFKAFPPMGRVLGIDWGLRRIGVAISDPTRQFFFVRPTLNFKAGATNHAQIVAGVAAQESVVAIVVGLPLYSDGAESDTTKMVKKFVVELEKYTDLPICLIEENLTSVVAQEEMGRVRICNLKEKLDSESALVILENAIAIINRSQ